MKKKLKYILLIFIFLLVLMVLFSPYGTKDGDEEKSVVVTVLVDAPVSEVFQYLGNSDNAKDWSVYVDHITPLNSETHKDGEKGAMRRCFQSENEKGIIWDEEILIVEANKRRRLNIVKMHGFSLMAKNLLTEQLYKEVDGKCEVSFTLFFEKDKSRWIDEFKMYYAAYIVSNIFKGNLGRVKEIVELKSNKKE